MFKNNKATFYAPDIGTYIDKGVMWIIEEKDLNAKELLWKKINDIGGFAVIPPGKDFRLKLTLYDKIDQLVKSDVSTKVQFISIEEPIDIVEKTGRGRLLESGMAKKYEFTYQSVNTTCIMGQCDFGILRMSLRPGY
jgi:hypothetical protein